LKNKPDVTVLARFAVDAIWKSSDLKGRCWGPKGSKRPSPYAGTNITLAIKDELITVCLNKETGALILHEFKRVKRTKLGRKIRQLLQGKKLPLQS
jgi:hypothetical protein